MRRTAALALVVVLFIGAAPKKKVSAPAPAAPDAVPHSIALFLGSLSRDGARAVTFRATARGTRFFLEEPTGVTVYRFDAGQYVKQEFLKGMTLAKAVKLKRFEKL
jgi:hypothetical protein